MKLNIETNERMALSARVPVGAHMDAATLDERAGIEFSADLGSLSTAANDRVRGEQGDALVTLDLHPETMRRLALTLLKALGTPAFTKAEWLEIAELLVTGTPDADERARSYAERILGAYER